MNKNYTAGPWFTDRASISHFEKGRIGHAYMPVSEDAFNNRRKERLANAKLMAAAPELVEALIDQAKETAMWHKETSGSDSFDAVEFAEIHWQKYLTESARAALTKAGILTQE